MFKFESFSLPGFSVPGFLLSRTARLAFGALCCAITGWMMTAAAAPAHVAMIYQATAVADTYVSSFSAGTNYGAVNTLQQKSPSPFSAGTSSRPTAAGATAISYIRFNLPEMAGRPGKATLKVYSQTASAGFEVRSVTGPWEELSVTYASAPQMGPVVASSGPFPAGQWVSVDILPLVTGPGPVNLALTTQATSYVTLSSRRVSTQAPQLEVQTNPTFYVDPVAGNDANVGATPASAWKSLAKVSSASLAPGDVVLFKRGGVWNGELTLARSGLPGAPVQIGAYGTGNLPVIQGGGSCVYLDGSNIWLTEVQLQGCAWAGVEIYGTNNRVEKAILKDNAAGVVVYEGGNSNAILNNQMINNNKMSVLTSVPTNDDSGAFGVLLLGDGNDVGYNTISGSDAFSYDYGRDGAAVEVYGGKNNFVHHNRTSQNNTFTEIGERRATDNTFAFNSFHSTLHESIFLVTRGPNDVFGPVTGTKLYHNSTNLTGSVSQGFVCYAGCGPTILTMRNNIMRAVGKVGFADAAFNQDHNLFSAGLIQFLADITSLVDPGYVDSANGDMHLNPLSPARDAGANLGLSPDLDGRLVPIDGNGDGVAVPDIGAFEYRP